MVGPHWDPTWTAVCPAQSAERPDIGQAEVERYRQQLEKAREQPEAILVLVCHWRNRGKPPDFIRFHGWLYHFSSLSQWMAFVFGRYTKFSDKPTWKWIGGCPHPRSEDRIWGSFISCHRADRMLKLRQYGDGLLVLPLLLLLLLLLLLIYLASDLIIAIAWIKALG